jgi:uncharacterized protein
MATRNFARAQAALAELKAAVLAEIDSSEQGLTNAAIVKSLGLESEYEGKNRNYLSWSILGLLLSEKKVRYRGTGQGKRYITRDDQR